MQSGSNLWQMPYACSYWTSKEINCSHWWKWCVWAISRNAFIRWRATLKHSNFCVMILPRYYTIQAFGSLRLDVYEFSRAISINFHTVRRFVCMHYGVWTMHYAGCVVWPANANVRTLHARISLANDLKRKKLTIRGNYAASIRDEQKQWKTFKMANLSV